MAIPSDTDMELYCSNKKALIRTMCRTSQWSGVTEGEITDWLYHNFKETKGRYFAIKILLHALYYSEANLIELLKDGIYSKIFGDRLKTKLINDGNIYHPRSEMESIINGCIAETLFIPLLDSNSPSESGNSMIRYLTHKTGMSPVNAEFHFKVDLAKLDKYKYIVIVDDCLGSGQQIYDFWNTNSAIGDIKKEAQSRGIEIFYLILIGNEDALLDLQLNGDLQGLKVRICEKLSSDNRVFEVSNNIWNGDQEEMDEAIKYLDQIEAVYQVPRKGYNELDFAVFIHNTTPDWSLPIFWKQNSDWKPLFKRKNSANV
ncbi:hypothetical protein FFJ24_021290 [Pedobacter sp. KBS0701]|uniref:phosphoribosyltransferase-like protein n=1 Tax=Pedobacter sp. KBS0701 TaxID=2578106 RepID=UPI00110DBC1A|nr:hypothetical protein [Pedobacter sp. KBS0701]QDW27223.1 hypothetical protein FFJ24_021290 [Pedobacter sp. KBS0701]